MDHTSPLHFVDDSKEIDVTIETLSWRDTLAAIAMHAQLTNVELDGNEKQIARHCYAIADAMLDARD